MPRRSRSSSGSVAAGLSPGKGNGEDKTLDTNTPAVDMLYGYTSGLIAATVLQTAQDLGIFDALAESGGPWTAGKLAKSKGFHAESTERLLNTLTSMQLLVRETKASKAVYKNSDVGQLLVKNDPNTLREMVSWMGFFNDALKTLPDIVKNGPEAMGFGAGEMKNSDEEGKGQGKKSVEDMEKCHHGNFHDKDGNVFDEAGNKVHGPGNDHGGHEKSAEDMEKCHHGNLHDKDGNVFDKEGNKVHGPGNDHGDHETPTLNDKKDGTPEGEEDWEDCCGVDFYVGMHNLLGSASAKLMTAVDLSGYKSAVDLGGGSGILCIELKRQYPNMDVTLFEKENIVKMFKESFLPGNEDLKIKTMEGDWDKTPLPKADLYILSQVVHEISNSDEILKKVYSALSPGGGILILENILADDKASLMQPALWDLIMMTHGSTLRSPAEFRSWLTDIGFQDVLAIRTQENNEYDVIYAKKPEHSDNKKSKK